MRNAETVYRDKFMASQAVVVEVVRRLGIQSPSSVLRRAQSRDSATTSNQWEMETETETEVDGVHH